MPPRKTRGKKRKTKGKKRRKQKGGAAKLAQILKASARRQAKRAGRGARSAARYAKRNPGRIAGLGAGAAGLGLAGYEGYLGARRGMDVMNSRMIDLPEGAEDPYASPTAAAFRRGRRGVTATRDYFTNPNRNIRRDITGRAYSAAEGADAFVRSIPRRGAEAREYFSTKGSGILDFINPKRIQRRGAKRREEEIKEMGEMLYGKRRRRKKKKSSFGKKAKKPSAALKRMCKKHKVRLTLKRGKKRVYKSEAMLKKQCKKAMKRKKKKSKK
tara:strand:+ start:3959 stop:4771 length:813 start_codon:yes stop_codon:yes gene_type:complete